MKLAWTDGCCVMWRFRTRCEVLRPAEPRSRTACSSICSGSLFLTSTTRSLRLAAVQRQHQHPVPACMSAGFLHLPKTCPLASFDPQQASSTRLVWMTDAVPAVLSPYSAVRCGCWPRLTRAATSSCGLCSLNEGSTFCRKSLRWIRKKIRIQCNAYPGSLDMMHCVQCATCTRRQIIWQMRIEPRVAQRMVQMHHGHARQHVQGSFLLKLCQIST